MAPTEPAPIDVSSSCVRQAGRDWPDDAFEQFWTVYPRKNARARAEKALRRLKKAQTVGFQDLLAGVVSLIAQRREPRFIPYAVTWLNDRRWEDEPDLSPRRPSMMSRVHGFRVPPHDIESEQALLGAILVNNDAFDRVSDFLLPEHFAEETHQRIFEITAKLVRGGKIATPITLKTFLGDHDLGGFTVPQYLARLAAEATTIINAADHGRRIRDLAVRRGLIAIGEEIVDVAFDAPVDHPPREQIKAALRQLLSVAL